MKRHNFPTEGEQQLYDIILIKYFCFLNLFFCEYRFEKTRLNLIETIKAILFDAE